MANKEHLALLKQGVELWNDWRKEHKNIVPDLSKADLSGANLSVANLSVANLSKANLSGANLSGANLSEAKLGGTNFSGANLSEANLSGADLSEADLSGADLSGANLSGTNLSEVDLLLANLPKLDAVIVSHFEQFKSLSELALISPEDVIAYQRQLLEKLYMPARDTVQFTAYYPRETKADTRYSFLLYAHTEEAFENIEKDIKKFKEELGNKVPPPKTAKQTTQVRLDTPITVVPECEQIEFDPPSLTKKWDGEWTRFGFDFKPTQAMSGDTLFIRVSVQVATVEVAHINCAVEVTEEKTESPRHIAEAENPLAGAKINSNTAYLYQSIFVSYSRKDKEVVKVYKLVQEAVGNIAFKDTDSIRAGEDWRAALARAIDQVDILQLFWSENSAQSENVHDEWEYALKHKCPDTRCVGFIRPVCWNDPIKPSPPKELDHLNFKYVPLGDLVSS